MTDTSADIIDAAGPTDPPPVPQTTTLGGIFDSYNDAVQKQIADLTSQVSALAQTCATQQDQIKAVTALVEAGNENVTPLGDVG